MWHLFLLLFLSVLAVIPPAAAQSASFGLYTRRRYRIFNADNSTDTCPAGCKETDECISVSGSNFWIDSKCYSRPRGRSTSFTEAGMGTVCRATHTDATCTSFIDADSPCVNTTVGECDSGTTTHDYYTEFCVQATEPVGDYIVPMASLFAYDSLEDCEADSNMTDGSEFTIPADRDLCLAEVSVDKGTWVRFPGGSRVYCDSSGNLQYDFFLDRQCSEQDENIQLNTRITRRSTCQAEPISGATRVSCDIQYFCKDLDGTPAAVRIEITGSTSSGFTAFLSFSVLGAALLVLLSSS